MQRRSRVPVLMLMVGACGGWLSAAIQIQLNPDLLSPRPLGTTITWTTTASDSNPGTLSYRFNTGPTGGTLALARDFQVSNSFQWTPHDREGAFQVQVVVRNNSTLATAQFTAAYQITSLVTGNQPVITPTAHPLVALYSAPPCPVGSSIKVKLVRALYSQFTPTVPCVANVSTNFYIAGMMANATYQMSQVIVTGFTATQGPTLQFTAGPLPSTIDFPKFTALKPATSKSSLNQNILLHGFIVPTTRPVATDFSGNILWYYPQTGLLDSPVLGGTMLLSVSSTGGNSGLGRSDTLREIDLAGNTVRETTTPRISEQLLALGANPITSINSHEAFRLPNGYTALLANTERLFPAGTQGSPTTVDILGNLIVILDQNFQVNWYWDAFNHLDVSRRATLGEVCQSFDRSCPPVTLASQANDWLHSNSIEYTPLDGNLVVSLRNQDWVIKIDYNYGTGSGNVLWRLGPQGDFTLTSTDPYPWFTHQHDARFDIAGTKLSLFDNGNTRVAQTPGNSRGQVLKLNEAKRTATLVVNADLGSYSSAFGSAQALANFDYHFLSGWIGNALFPSSQDVEVSTDGTVQFNMQSKVAATYRSFRLSSFYAP